MDFKNIIFMTDLDGSLLTSEKKIHPRDMAAIERFRAGGGIFTIATGRGYSMAKRIAEEICPNVPCVIFNGAAVYDFNSDKFLWRCEIDSKAREYIRKITDKFSGVGVEVLCEQTVYVPFMNEYEQHHLDMEGVVPDLRPLDEIPDEGWLKFLFTAAPEVLDEIEKMTESGFEDVTRMRSAAIFYECLPNGVDKSRGFAELIKIVGAENRFSVALGDYKNDAAMIKNANLGVAVANALDEVKAVADLVVCDNNSAPISEIIDYLESR